MKLTADGIGDRGLWEQAGVRLPAYEIGKMREYTKRHPVWLHFGAGNIFRGYLAALQQRLLEGGNVRAGIIAADTFDYDIIDRIYAPFDNLTLLVGLKADGSTEKSVIGSVAEAVRADSGETEAWERLKTIFAAKDLQMVSYTITEKGYALTDMQGSFFPAAVRDMEEGPDHPRHAMGITAALLYHRFLQGGGPLALVSMDNCSRNGEKLQAGVWTIAKKWLEKGYVEPAFLDYLHSEDKIAFPWSMIDKITPRPSARIEAQLTALGVEDMSPITTDKNNYIAPFVNAELPQYLVIEDKFPGGRPPLEMAGVYMTDRKTVNATERMKVSACLNPLHTALAVYGCLLGFDSIAAEMQDVQLKRLAEKIGYEEGMPVVTDPGIIRPSDFIREVLEERLPNPFIPDMPQRIATDTSQKLPVRFGETLRAYAASPSLDVKELTGIPLVIAGWLRYLLGVDDLGMGLEISPDPMRETLQQYLSGIRVGEPESAGEKLKPILSNKALFAVDLYEIGLGEKILGMFTEMLAGDGAVRKTLCRYLD